MHGKVSNTGEGSKLIYSPRTGSNKQECRPADSDLHDLRIDSTAHKHQPAPQAQVWKPAAAANGDLHHQHAMQADPCSIHQQHSQHSCTLQGDGKLTKPSQPSVNTANSTSSKPASQEQPQEASHDEALAMLALASQSCSLATDVEIMDRVFDELVMLDPVLSKALLHAPPVHFTTVTPEQHDTSNTADDQPQDTDDTRTFITACQVPESSHNTQAFAHNLSMLLPAEAADTSKATPHRPSAFFAAPELAASTDIFSWKNSSQTGSFDGARARLHSLTFDPTLQQKSSAGSLGVRWADGGYVSTSGAVEQHTPRSHRLLGGHHSVSGAAPRLSLSLASLPKQQNDHLTAALVSSIQYQQQQIPSMDELKYQMDDIRKLHLAGVTANTAVVQQQQLGLQLQQVAGQARPVTADARAGSPGKAVAAAVDPLATYRTSPSTPKYPQQSARQQQPAWQRLLAAQNNSKDISKGPVAKKSFVGMRASAPSWKRS